MATMNNYFEDMNSFNTSQTTEAQGNSSSTIAYMLFLYREELRRLNKHGLRLSKSKLHLTQELVSYSVDRITEYDMQELMNINREISFTRKLKSHMDHLKERQKFKEIQAQLEKELDFLN